MSHAIILIGASGHAAVVAQAAVAAGDRVCAHLADSPSPLGITVDGPVADLPKVSAAHPGCRVFVAIGDNHARKVVAERVRELLPGAVFATVIHPSAVICEEGSVGAGAFVAAGAIVGAGASVGDFAILNTRASLDHHSTLGDFASMAPAHIGMGAMVHHGVTIGAHAILGSLALANKDIPASEVWVGNPARPIKRRQEGESYL